MSQSESTTLPRQTNGWGSFAMPGISAILGLVAGYLFFDRALGISLPVFVILGLAALYGLAYYRRVKPSRQNTWLAAALIFFAVMFSVRAESFTSFLNVCAALLLTLLLAHLYRGRGVQDFELLDYLQGVIISIFEIVLLKPAAALAEIGRTTKGSSSPRLAGILRGLILAIPILLVFSVLFSSADAAFSSLLEDLLHQLRLDNIPELVSRLVFSLIVAWCVLGGLAYALRTVGEKQSQTPRSLNVPLGITEAVVVLTSVDLLFLLFVGIQFRYFFGGQSNIHIAGLTYSEYARRGFAELLVVTVFSLGLALLLQWLTKRETRRSVTTFEVLAGLLIALTGVILVSAFQRLLLYERAYGFTELRFFTYVFMGWMGVLLVVFLVSLHFNQQRWFAFGTLLVGLGFIVTLNLLNTDAFIVRQNLARYEVSGDLDAAYLATLSDDAVPALLAALDQVGSEEREVLGSALHFRLNQLEKLKDQNSWMEWHYSHSRAYSLLEAVSPELEPYEPRQYDWEFPID
jgi:hypothetical protein